MSYILEALKKSDQERNRGEVPSIETVQPMAAPVEPKSSNKTYWIVGLLGLNLLVAVFWLGIQFSDKAVQPAPIATATAIDSRQPVSSDVGSPQPTTVRSAEKVVAEPVVSSPVLAKPAAPKPELAPSQPVATSVTQPKAEVRVEAEKYSIVKPVLENTSVQADESFELIKPSTPQQEVITPSSQPAANARVEPEIDYTGLPYLAELSRSERAGIPQLSFSSHMYSSSPEFRTVVINGSSLREGEALARGLYVTAITEEGVVLDNDGVAFRVNVMQEWTFE